MAGKKQKEDNDSLVRAYIGLGSNEGDRVGFVQQAMQLLKDIPRIQVRECSSLYETEPVGAVQSIQWFVNAVAAIDTDLDCQELLEVLKDIERRLTELHGHTSAACNLPSGCRSRIIDLDILFYGDHVVDNGDLRVPHISLNTRAFALVPLLEIAPDFLHPGLKQTIAELHEQLAEPEQVYLYGTRGLGGEFL